MEKREGSREPTSKRRGWKGKVKGEMSEGKG